MDIHPLHSFVLTLKLLDCDIHPLLDDHRLSLAIVL
jgi:hypothetical protein